MRDIARFAFRSAFDSLLPHLPLLVVIAVLAAVMPPPLEAGVLDSLKPGEWYEVPNSHLRDVVPSYPVNIGNPAGIVTAWNSAAYDTKRDRLIVTGGGHNDYGGNELYAFDLNTLKWSVIWGPSPNIPPQSTRLETNCVETESDGNPVSRHTYDGLEYLPNVDGFWMAGGSKYCRSGSSSQYNWIFDLTSKTWHRKADPPYRLNLEMVSAYAPSSGEVLMAGKSSWQKLIAYDPVSDTWRVRGDLPIGFAQTATVDTKRNWFISIGEGKVWKYDLNTSGTTRREELSTTGSTEIVSVRYPGVAYDPVSDRIVAWHGGPSVYALDLDTLVWTKLLPTNSVVPAPAPKQGTYGRWQYVPSKNVFIGVTGVDDNVWIYRLSNNAETTSAPPPPDSIPPSVSIVSPSQGATISGTLTLQATASDASGIAGLTFQIDGQVIAGEDTQAPFEVNWDSAAVGDGVHTLRASARDTAGNTATDSITITVANASTNESATPPPSLPPTGWIDIPTGVFVAFEAPAPYSGDGVPGNNKHITAAYNPDDGRIYITGGDYSGAGDWGASYRQETWSFSLHERFADITNPAAGWRLEYPYCGPAGGVQPKHPDFVGFTWDPNRKLFWMVPGTMVRAPWNCPGETYDGQDNPGFLYKNIMTFDPNAPLVDRWKNYDSNKPPHTTPPEQWMSIYDPVNDELVQLTKSGNAIADHYDIGSKTWTTYSLGVNALGQTIEIAKEVVAADMEARVIYVVDFAHGRLHRYHLDSHVMDDLGPVPDGGSAKPTTSSVAWDSINKVLFYWHYDTKRLHVYHPDTGTWETPAMIVDVSRIPNTTYTTVSGRGLIFDPGANALFFPGTRHDPQYAFWVYRYGNGGSSGTPDLVPPDPPSGLRVN